jgi:uncharacterized protein YaiE (UPF0345 family)
VRCTREGVHVDVGVNLLVKAAVEAAVLGLNGQSLVARVTQASATSCAVQCGTAPASVVNGITVDGSVEVPFPTVAGEGTTECTVSCAGSGGVEEGSGAAFPIFGGPVDSQTRLNALAASNAVALQGDIGLINPTTFDLGDRGTLEIVSGAINVQCNGATTLREIVAGSIREIGGRLTVEDCDRNGFNVFFDELQTVGGALSVTNNGGLGTLTMSSLQTVGGALSVTNNGGLGTLTMSSLQTVGGALSINNNALLTNLNLSGLRQVGIEGGLAENLEIQGNAELTPAGSIFNIIFPAAATPPPIRVFGALRIRDNFRISDQQVALLAQRVQADSTSLTGNIP